MGAKSLKPSSVKASEEHTDIVLREAAALMQPVALWLLRSGVPYGAFADLLKGVFVEAARTELIRAGSKVTHSALSVSSGVHRKDVRTLDEKQATPERPTRAISLASQIYTRWLTDARYRSRNGQPRTLDRSGAGVSFESLARDVSNDIHPRTVLEELIRLRLVDIDAETDRVSPAARAFVPSRELDEMMTLFGANAADHLAAAVHNLTLGEPRFLEQSIFATGLSKGSTERLHDTARAVWQQAFETMATEGRRCIAADGEVPETFRMRFGVYYYSEPALDEMPGPALAAPAKAKKPKATAVKGNTVRAKASSRRRKVP